MNKNWPTKNQDLYIAQAIMEEYAREHNTTNLGLFEMIVNEKRMDFRLASWVMALAQKFHAMYGASHGDYITRQVITGCMVRGETVH